MPDLSSAGRGGADVVLTYKDVRPWAKAIREAVMQKKMPPWFADPAHGEFSNDRRLAARRDRGHRELGGRRFA